MPKEITHLHVAEEIRSKLPPDFRDLLHRRDGAYCFGSMSPDLYYYDVRLPLEKKHSLELGEIIHGRYGNDNSMHVLWMLEKCVSLKQENPDAVEPAFAFLCGYLTHVAADTIFHPYIYSVTGNYYHPDLQERTMAEARHRLFESMLDLYILQIRDQSLEEFKLLDRLDPGEHTEELLQFLTEGMSRAHSEKMEMPASHEIHWITKRSFKRSRTMIGLYQSRLLLKILHAINRKMKGKISHISHLGYINDHNAREKLDFESLDPAPHPVTGRPYGGPVHKLMEESLNRGRDYLDVCWKRLSGEADVATARKVLRPLSLNNGLEFTPTEKMVHYQVHPALNIL